MNRVSVENAEPVVETPGTVKVTHAALDAPLARSNWWQQTLLKEAQTLLSVFYIALVALGMLFEYHKYERFGINIFQYADVFDFLIAPFRDPRIFLFTFANVVFIFFVYLFDKWLQRKFPTFYHELTFRYQHKSWYRYYRIGSFVFAFVVYLWMFSVQLASRHYARVENAKEQIQLNLTNGATITGALIGKTKETVFLFENDEVRVVPLNDGVQEIRFVR